MTDRIFPGIDVDLDAGLMLIDLRAIIENAGLQPGLVSCYSLTADVLRGVRIWRDEHKLPEFVIATPSITSGGPARDN